MGRLRNLFGVSREMGMMEGLPRPTDDACTVYLLEPARTCDVQVEESGVVVRFLESDTRVVREVMMGISS
jgi:hypothetical protein